MIVTLSDTTASEINRRLTEMRHAGGAVALSRVLTLVILSSTTDGEAAIQAANDASREHPCRIIAVLTGQKRGKARIDAEIRVGGDAGASEVIVTRLTGPLTQNPEAIVLPLLLPDAPTVAWWPAEAPDVLAEDSVGRLAQRRITDSAHHRHPVAVLNKLREGYRAGDTDLAWTRLTNWRAALAGALDQPPFDPVTEAVVGGEAASPSTELLAGWLAAALDCPVRRKKSSGPGIVSVELKRASGSVKVVRPDGRTATLDQPGQPTRQLALPRRTLSECLAEELRRLDPDEIYEETLTEGLPLLEGQRTRAAATRAAAGTEGDR